MIEFAGPADVFAAANHAAGKTVYRVIAASPQGRAVTMHGGFTMSVTDSLQEISHGVDTVDTRA